MAARTVFLTYDDMMLSVFDSQVLMPARRLRDLGLVHDFIGFCTAGARLKGTVGRRIETITDQMGGRAEIVTTLPWIGRFDLAHPISAARRSLGRLGIRDEDDVIIHARGHYASFIAVSLKRRYPKLRVIANLRGVAGPEFAQYSLPGIPAYRLDWHLISRALLRRLERWERMIASEADELVCVSNAFKRYLDEAYSLPDGRVNVVTTAVNTDLFRFDPEVRRRMRAELGFESKTVLAYCGSMYGWEMPRSALDLLSRMLSGIPDAHLLVITTHPADARTELGRVGVPSKSVTIVSLPHKEVPKALTAADIGLLLREDNIVNNVAAPTKFGEYLACGLPVIVSPGVGDTSEVVSGRGVGWVLPDAGRHSGSVMERILRSEAGRVASRAYREHCAAVGRELYSWDRHIHSLARIYERLDG